MISELVGCLLKNGQLYEAEPNESGWHLIYCDRSDDFAISSKQTASFDDAVLDIFKKVHVWHVQRENSMFGNYELDRLVCRWIKDGGFSDDYYNELMPDGWV